MDHLWTMHYWHDASGERCVEHWLDALSHDEFNSVAKELKLLELDGNELKLPHSRALGHGLFEVRERHYNFRIYYTFEPERVILLLDAGNKQTQQRDIRLARERLTHLANQQTRKI
jgi:putative addiction module killer protein